MKLIVRKNNHRHRRVPKIIRQLKSKPVMVNKNGVQILIKQLSRYTPFEFIKPQIQELERRKLENNIGKLTGKAVITEIQFIKQLETVKSVGKSTAEPVRVDMEQCKISKQTELFREVSSNVAVVEIDTGDGTDFGVVQ